jgi:DNA polymerase-3 subunit epsilon
MREIIFDTETTGLDARRDRVVEIGGIELINHIPTGKSYHQYMNPEMPMPAEAYAIHGLDDAFLRDKPKFAAIADEFLEFIGDARLIAHNATFDMNFINAELGRLSKPPIPNDRVVDTLILARQKFPGSPASLDALMSRFGVDASRRTLHGALLDSELLAEVYIELIGGRQAALGLGIGSDTMNLTTGIVEVTLPPRAAPRRFNVSPEELAGHAEALEKLGEKAVWHRYLKTDG